MLIQSNLRLFSKWLKFYGLSNQLIVSSVTDSCHVNSLKSHIHMSNFSQSFGWCCSGHMKGRMLSEIGYRKCMSGPVPLLSVGEKAVVSMVITPEMVKCFAQATGDWNPIHFETGYSYTSTAECGLCKDKSDLFNKAPRVHGALLNGIVSGVIGTRLPGPGTVVVSQVFKFTAPLLVGSQVAVEVEVMNFKRREVNVRYQIVSIPDETLVMDGTARLMVPRNRIEKVS